MVLPLAVMVQYQPTQYLWWFYQVSVFCILLPIFQLVAFGCPHFGAS